MPVHHKIFQELNAAQLSWYQGQFILEEQEVFELFRDVAEHNAMFMNPEGVRKVKESRENTYQTSDEDFDELIKGTFGRELGKTKSDPYLTMDLDEISFIPEK